VHFVYEFITFSREYIFTSLKVFDLTAIPMRLSVDSENKLALNFMAFRVWAERDEWFFWRRTIFNRGRAILGSVDFFSLWLVLARGRDCLPSKNQMVRILPERYFVRGTRLCLLDQFTWLSAALAYQLTAVTVDPPASIHQIVVALLCSLALAYIYLYYVMLHKIFVVQLDPFGAWFLLPDIFRFQFCL
jgi:hypothetical protein